jgi:ArsR family transcriptional regulator, arsenate/arsenite/antimonite-responsive transcriptional repressor
MKTLDQTKHEERLVTMLRALGNPARFKIFQALRRQERCQCGTLVESLPLAQSTVSEHLRRLREAGLIVGEIDGPHPCYKIDHAALDWLQAQIGEL